MRVTVTDIAKHCGVSQPTVSRILNGHGKAFKPATVAKVQEAITQLGYRRDASALATRDKRTHGLGLLMDPKGYRSHTPRQLLNSLNEATAKGGQHLILDRISDEALSQGNTPKVLTHHLVDGFLINYEAKLPQGMQTLLDKFKVPSVWLNVKRDRGAFYPDEFEATKTVVAQLVAAGCERIVYLDPTYDGIPLERRHFSREDRLLGYHAAAAHFGFKAEAIIHNNEGFVTRLAQERAKTKAPLGIIFGEASPRILHEFWASVYGASLAPGQDVMPATFGQDDFLSTMPLLLVKAPWAAIGTKAVDALNRILEGNRIEDSEAIACNIEFTKHLTGVATSA